MTEQEKARIFDPFFTTKFASHGLGLALVQGIVSSHGGAINIVTAPGKGATFEVLLPCAGGPVKSAAPAAPIVTARERAAVSGSVLLVEDEDTSRLATSKALRKRGESHFHQRVCFRKPSC